MLFEWDERKRQSNLEKHGIDFEDAKTIWDGAFFEIARRKRGEERITIVGQIRRHWITVVYTERGGNIRIISARTANRKERPDRHIASR